MVKELYVNNVKYEIEIRENKEKHQKQIKNCKILDEEEIALHRIDNKIRATKKSWVSCMWVAGGGAHSNWGGMSSDM